MIIELLNEKGSLEIIIKNLKEIMNFNVNDIILLKNIQGEKEVTNFF